MKTVFLLIVTLGSLAFLTGCAVVTSENLIGDTAVQLSPEAWNGTWRNEETALQLKVIAPENGLLKIAWFEEKDNELQPESLTVQIRKGEQWEYLNLLEGSLYKDLALAKYCWGRIEKEGKRLLFWLPNPERFERAVASDTLKGKVIKTKKENSPSTHIRLNASSRKLIQQIESSGGEYFLWDKPLTFIKID